MKRCLTISWVLLCILDLLLTARADPSREANPVACYLWTEWGFGAVSVLKCVATLGMMAVWGWLWQEQEVTGLWQYGALATTQAVVCNTAGLAIVVWNFYCIV